MHNLSVNVCIFLRVEPVEAVNGFVLVFGGYNAKMQIDLQWIHTHPTIHSFNAILLFEVVGKGNGNEICGEKESFQCMSDH